MWPWRWGGGKSLKWISSVIGLMCFTNVKINTMAIKLRKHFQCYSTRFSHIFNLWKCCLIIVGILSWEHLCPLPLVSLVHKSSEWRGISDFPSPALLAISRPSLSPCSALRSTGELYLICDRIILLCSLHRVSQKWDCSGMRKSLVSSGACPCVQREGRHYTRMWATVRTKRRKGTVHLAPCSARCVFTCTTPSPCQPS